MTLIVEIIGWVSTALFLISILLPQRIHLHALGVVTSITTGIYAYHYGATAIWVKWMIAFFFHAYKWWELSRLARPTIQSKASTQLAGIR